MKFLDYLDNKGIKDKYVIQLLDKLCGDVVSEEMESDPQMDSLMLVIYILEKFNHYDEAAKKDLSVVTEVLKKLRIEQGITNYQPDIELLNMMLCYDAETAHKRELINGVACALAFLKKWQQELNRREATTKTTSQVVKIEHKVGMFMPPQGGTSPFNPERQQAEQSTPTSDTKKLC